MADHVRVAAPVRVGPVPQERAEVEPHAAGRQQVPKHVDVLQHVVRSVDEEASDHGVERGLALVAPVHFYEVPGAHGEVPFLQLEPRRRRVRERHRAELRVPERTRSAVSGVRHAAHLVKSAVETAIKTESLRLKSSRVE